MRAPDFSVTRLIPEIELAAPGKHAGRFGLLWSDYANPLGISPIPPPSSSASAGIPISGC